MGETIEDGTWNAVEDFFGERLIGPDEVLDAALADTRAAGMPEIAVAPAQGKLLNLLARLGGARSVLEIGTLGGYSTIWLARALPVDGRLITLELEPKHAEVARGNVERAGLSALVDVVVGPALASLQALVDEGAGPFDLVFIDADKANISNYVELALQVSRPGTLIVVDNVVRHGAVLDPDGDASVQGVRAFADLLGQHPALDGTVLQTVGVKGYDGLAFALVTTTG
jgi:predicted O-methyltransferase YrrM